MMRWVLVGLLFVFWSLSLSCAGEINENVDPPPDISEEDLKVIKHLETLEMMEMAEKLQFLAEMEILTEEEPDETDN